MKNFILCSVVVGVLSVGYLALAESRTGDKPIVCTQEARQCPDGSFVSRTGPNCEFATCKGQLQQNIKNAKTNLKTETEDTKERLKKAAETMKEDLKKRKEEFNEIVKTKKAELEVEIKVKREELKVRLEKIKDERKKETVEKIDQRIDALNEKMMQHFSNVLDKLEEMLVRISERADKASVERGLDISAVRSAVDKANTVIASARLAIEIQTGKTYTITITTESALKTDVGKTRQAFGADLEKVKDAVKAAHSAVKDAAVALARLVVKPKVSPSPTLEATPAQ